jgi:hypothetical protein
VRGKVVLFGIASVLAGIGAVSAAAEAGSAPAPKTRKVAIVAYDHMEILDFACPGEVFQSTGAPFEVYTVGECAGAEPGPPPRTGAPPRDRRSARRAFPRPAPARAVRSRWGLEDPGDDR